MSRLSCAISILLLALAVAVRPAAATERFVDGTAAAGGDGLSWGTAHRFLVDALGAAAPGDTVRVAQGTYRPDRSEAKPEGSGDRAATFLVPPSIEVLGGYVGLVGPDPDARDPLVFESRLDGALGDGLHAYHVLRGTAWTAATVVEGFTITGGQADGSGTDALGGGFLLDGASAGALRGCRVVGNAARQGGGGACRAGVTTRITLVTIVGNEATISGAGLQLVSTAAELIECALLDNAGDGGCIGGGLYVLGGAPQVTGGRIDGNEAHTGGGLYVQDGAPVLVGVTLSGNTARTDGGGAYLRHAGLAGTRLEGCVLEDNLAWNDGGGLLERSLAVGVTVVASTFRLNVAVNDGGGLHASGPAPARFEDLLIEGNVAGDFGGGVRWEDGAATTELLRCTIVANQADSGGGVSVDGMEGRIASALLEGNHAADGGGLHGRDAATVVVDCVLRANVADTGGGGLLAEASTLEVRDCLLVENVAGNSGAGVQARSDASVLSTCIFVANECLFFGSGGGAACLDGATTRFEACTFVGNTANFGGAIAVTADGAPTIEDCVLEANEAIGGGGISVVDGGVTVARSTLARNTATGSTVSDGGAIALRLAAATVTACLVEGNVADTDGGGISARESTLELDAVQLLGNHAEGRGGGLAVDGGAVEVVATFLAGNAARLLGGGAASANADPLYLNCVFSGNRALGVTAPTDDECLEPGFGGGVGARTGSPRLVNCTLSANTAECEGLGGGASLIFGAIENCILWGNQDATGTGEPAQLHSLAGIATVNHSCVQGLDAIVGVGNIGDDPALVAPAGSDGIAGTADDDLRLAAGSSGIDAADNTQLDEAVTTDLAGGPRFVDDPDTPDTGVADARPPVDMGAYELDPAAACAGDATGDGTVDVADLLAVLAVWGPCPGCPADLDGDGVVDVADLLAVLADWGCGGR